METVKIETETDIVHARHAARDFAAKLGFSVINKTRIATAVSELARNVFHHGGGGWMEIDEIKNGNQTGLQCVFIDEGPGIADVEEAMGEGFSTRGTLGQGLPGSKRLLDRMTIESKLGKGTRVEAIKWK